MPLLEYTGNAVLSTLAADLTPSATAMALTGFSGWPQGVTANWTATIDQGGSNEEKVLCGTRTDGTVNIIQRGYDDTSARAHSSGESVKHTISAAAMEEASQHVNNTALDQHTQYLNSARHTAIAHGTSLIADSAITSPKIADFAVITQKLADLAVTTAKLADGNITLAKLAAALQQLLVPTGTILEYGGAAAPAGFLMADGSAVSRVTYAALFAVIDVAYGPGDNVNTFNLPDRRGRFGLGKAGTGTGSTLGETGGSLDHTHDLNTASSYAAITVSDPLDVIRLLRKSTGSYTSGFTIPGTVTNVGTSENTGVELGGTSGTANPPFQVFNYIIKT